MLCVTFNKQYKKANTEDYADNVMMLDSVFMYLCTRQSLDSGFKTARSNLMIFCSVSSKRNMYPTDM